MIFMKKVLSILLCILMFVSVCPVAVFAADGGDGSTEDLPSSAIAISNVDELVMICNEYPADGYYYLTGDIDLSYALGEYGDYYNDGKGWEPIGNSNTPFKGTFDGRGYTIKGLSINRPEQDYIGLFGYAATATFKNCKLDIVNIVGASYTGGLLGKGETVNFENCDLSITKLNGSSYVGGFLGQGNTVNIEHCKIEPVELKGTNYVGGFLGEGKTVNIKNCETLKGKIITDSTAATTYCGGLVATISSDGTINNCINRVVISMTAPANCDYIKDPYTYGRYLESTKPTYSHTGGIVGSFLGATIFSCINYGNISAEKTSFLYAGGIAGSFTGSDITLCKNDAQIISKSDYYYKDRFYHDSTGTSISRDYFSTSYTGGIAGLFSGKKIDTCVNNAKIIATAKDEDGEKSYAGGIAGRSSNGGYVERCVNLARISMNNAYANHAIQTAIGSGFSTVENCYNFSSASTLMNSGTAKNCYSISSFTAENGTVWLSNGSQVTRTNKQMRLKSTFEGFDFENTWTMEGNPDFPYPELISNPSSFKKSLASISVAALPDKVNYLEGKDEFDITGAILRLTYDNGTTEKIPMTAEMVSGFDNTIVGTNRIKVQYGGFETSFNVTVIARSLVSISVSKMPTKTEYLEGKDEFSPSGGELTLTYNNGTSKTVDMKDAAFTGFDNSTSGVQTVTVSYGGKTTTLKVTVIEKTLEKIELTTLPSKTQYLEGKDKLQKDGGIITLYYNNGKTATVSLNDADVTGFNNRVVGTQTLTVHYMEKTAQFEVKIIAKSVSRISVASVPDVVTYLEGKDELSADGGKIAVYYNNDTEDEIFMDASMLSGFDCDTVGMQTITVTYGGKTAFFEIEVIAKTLEKIELLSAPAKKTYREKKDTLNLSGARINLIYNNGTTAPLEITDEMVSGFDNSVIGKQTITVTYMGKTTTFEVEIIAKTAMSISVTQKPDKLTYLEGKDELDVTGGVITVYYDNDSTSTMVMTPDMITGFDNSKPGTQTLTVTYLGKTATFDVVIKAKSLVGFELVKNPVKTVYKEGEALSLEGIAARFSYDNGEITDLPVSLYFASGFDSRKVGKQTVTITIDTYVDSFEVTVEHDYKETVVPSTCTKKGYSVFTCSVCGDSYRDKETDLAPHTYLIKTVSATCTAKGYTEYTCAVCGYTYKDNYVDEKPHDTVHHNGKPATCTEKGYAEYDTCKNCNYTTYKEINALGHEEQKINAVAPSCTKSGLTEGKRCSRCGVILVAQTEIGMVAHQWDNGTVTKAAAPGVKGEKVFTCTVCKTTVTEEIPALAQHKKGDVDLDGIVSVADARLALRAAVGLDTLSDEKYFVADVDGQDGISVADARLILRVAVGLDKFDD